MTKEQIMAAAEIEIDRTLSSLRVQMLKNVEDEIDTANVANIRIDGYSLTTRVAILRALNAARMQGAAG